MVMYKRLYLTADGTRIAVELRGSALNLAVGHVSSTSGMAQ